MKHNEIEQLLPWYANGTLADDEHLVVERHVNTCTDCAEELQMIREVSEVVGESQPVPSHDVLADVLTQIKRENHFAASKPSLSSRLAQWFKDSFSLKQGSPLLMAAAAAMLCIIGYQNLVQIPELRSPGLAVTMSLKEGIRGSGVQQVTLSPDDALVLKLDHPGDPDSYAAYAFRLEGQGRKVETAPIGAPANSEPYVLNFQKGWPEGKYTLTLFGLKDDTTQSLNTYSFSIKSKEGRL